MHVGSWGTAEFDALGSLMGGVFTALALAATLYVVLQEARQRRIEQEVERQRRSDEEARQAQLIFSDIIDESYPLNHSGILELGGFILNYSDGPIFNLWVSMPEFGEGFDLLHLLSPGKKFESKAPFKWKHSGEAIDMGFLGGWGLRWSSLTAMAVTGEGTVSILLSES